MNGPRYDDVFFYGVEWLDSLEAYPGHIDSKNCWCGPELEYEDPATGNRVWVHKDFQ